MQIYFAIIIHVYNKSGTLSFYLPQPKVAEIARVALVVTAVVNDVLTLSCTACCVGIAGRVRTKAVNTPA